MREGLQCSCVSDRFSDFFFNLFDYIFLSMWLWRGGIIAVFFVVDVNFVCRKMITE